MRLTLIVPGVLLLVALAGCFGGRTSDGGLAEDQAWHEPEAPTIIAVVDNGFDPYHWDFLAAHMPQHQNPDSTDDLPLWDDPADWLPDFPGRDAFASYGPLDLTLTPDDDQRVPQELHDNDPAWKGVESSTLDFIHFRYIPGTKVVGFVTFGDGDGFASASHGVGTTSVSVGNYHGSCPDCLLVFVDGSSEQADRWVEQQGWIDVQTNSWGASAVSRDRFYAGSDVESQRAAVERGQAIFFSAGNGQANEFTVPSLTLFSSQEGPDWILTVGAISPEEGASYTGQGKPVDVAGVGNRYRRAGGATVTDQSYFGGTSSSTPVVAGLYGEALHRLRQRLDGTRLQENNTLASGPPGCSDMNLDCPLADGVLTYPELRDALLDAAQRTPAGQTIGIVDTLAGEEVVVPGTENLAEMEALSEGHGSFWGRLHSGAEWEEEVQRIVDSVTGDRGSGLTMEQQQWRIALSHCRQALWGEWGLGHASGAVLPEPDPEWPVRTWFVEQCPVVGPAIIAVDKAVTELPPER